MTPAESDDPNPFHDLGKDVFLHRREAAYSLLLAAFSVVLVLTNILGVKLFLVLPNVWPGGMFGEPVTLTSGIITYPLTFLITDVVSEIYGRKRANFMVFVGFLLSLLMLVLIQIVGWLPSSPVWVVAPFTDVSEMELAYDTIFKLPGYLLFGSMTAYLVAQFIDIRLFHFWRTVTGGRHLWLRNNGSTFISQFVDTIIVNTIFLGLGLALEWDLVWQIIAANYVFKMLLAIIDTPLIYLGVFSLNNYLKKGDDMPMLSEAPAE